jgi:hypothetical protein
VREIVSVGCAEETGRVTEITRVNKKRDQDGSGGGGGGAQG